MTRPALHLFYLLVLPALAAPSARTSDKKIDFDHDSHVRSAWIERCRDGDTCRVRTADGLWFNVRLSGIDAPELRRKGRHDPFAEEARDVLNQLAGKKTLKLRQTDLDRYNRPVVELLSPDGIVINHIMVRRGLATAYRGPAGSLVREPYLVEEANAKAAGRGLWAHRTSH